MAAPALATLASLCPAPARAGHYKVTYTASSPANGQAQEILPINNGPDPGYNYGNSHASGTITLTVHATAVWTPDGTGDASAPPPSQPFRETLSAFGVEGATGGGVTVDDGAGDQPVSSSTPIYYDGVVIQDTEQDVADGRHLLTGSGATITLPTRTMVVTFSGGASGTVGLCYAVEIDSRAVSISRTEASLPGVILSPDGQPHGEYVDADGTGHGETIYSYVDDETNDGTGSSEQDCGNWLTFSSNFTGSWSQKIYTTELNGQTNSYTDYDVTWSWYPSESNDTLHTGLWKMPYGGMNIDNGNWVGTPSPAVPGYITYTATDNENPATATAAYDVTVHEPWDNKRNANPATTAHSQINYAVGTDGFPIGVGNTTGQPQAAAPTVGLSITTSVTLGFNFSPTFSVGWAQALGIAVNLGGTLSATVNVTDPGPELQPQQEAFPYVLTSWTTDHYWVDNYSSSGYVGTPVESADDPNSGTHLLCWTTPQPISQSPP